MSWAMSCRLAQMDTAWCAQCMRGPCTASSPQARLCMHTGLVTPAPGTPDMYAPTGEVLSTGFRVQVPALGTLIRQLLPYPSFVLGGRHLLAYPARQVSACSARIQGSTPRIQGLGFRVSLSRSSSEPYSYTMHQPGAGPCQTLASLSMFCTDPGSMFYCSRCGGP